MRALFFVFIGQFPIFVRNQLPHMKHTETLFSPEGYVAPSLRVTEIKQECAFLASSNLEPIEGGDDPDIDW
jgi:hypothetical protein